MADKKTCREFSRRFSSTGYCPKPAKYICLIEMTNGVRHTKVQQPRCGIHAKRYEKVEKL